MSRIGGVGGVGGPGRGDLSDPLEIARKHLRQYTGMTDSELRTAFLSESIAERARIGRLCDVVIARSTSPAEIALAQRIRRIAAECPP